MTRYRASLLLGTALAVMTIVGAPTCAVAQSTSENREIAYAIPAQGLSSALRQFAEASGLQLVYDAKIAADKSSPGVTGTMSSQAALTRVLAGSGLVFQFSGDRVVIITVPAAVGSSEPGVRAVGVVNVEGASGTTPFGEMVSPVNGTNGSRDVEATEGTGSYTTGATSIVSKIPTSLKDTPQTVSVATSQKIADQNLVGIKDILETLPGISVAPGGNTEAFEIYSRGFRVTTYSLDGGAPTTYDYNSRPALNMAEFDSVQLGRGATGLFGGYGDPGGMVNLVRKKPLDHEQLTFEEQLGSWMNLRAVADYTGPLTADKSLRGRVVASYQRKDYFYDVARAEKMGAYGILEYDLTPKTLLTVGASYNRENNITNVGGLPRYQDGTPINWPTSTCLCVPWGRDKVSKVTAFATISHQISANWFTKLNFTFDDQYVDGVYVGASAQIARGATSAQGRLGGFSSINPVQQFAVDYTVNGKFTLFGRQHTVAVGANYQNVNNDGGSLINYRTIIVPDIFAFNPSSYIDPKPTVNSYFAVKNRQEAYGIYGNLSLQVLKHLRVSVGMRYSEIIRKSIFQYDYTPVLDRVPDLKDRSFSQPNLGVNYDITRNLTFYASHQNIYQPQFGARYLLNGASPPPITGSNDEGGIKWESSNKKINASLAAYRIIQNGFLGEDYSGPVPTANPQIFDTTSKGIDFEVTGEILAGWQVSANYTYNDSIIRRSSFFSRTITTLPKYSYAPQNIAKLWTTYRGAEGSALARVILGGGVNYQSKAFRTGSVCVLDPAQPANNCPRQVMQEFTTDGYATFALKAGYQAAKNIELSVNVNNVANLKKYIPTNQQSILKYNYYIEPRNILISARFKW